MAECEKSVVNCFGTERNSLLNSAELSSNGLVLGV